MTDHRHLTATEGIKRPGRNFTATVSVRRTIRPQLFTHIPSGLPRQKSRRGDTQSEKWNDYRPHFFHARVSFRTATIHSGSDSTKHTAAVEQANLFGNGRASLPRLSLRTLPGQEEAATPSIPLPDCAPSSSRGGGGGGGGSSISSAGPLEMFGRRRLRRTASAPGPAPAPTLLEHPLKPRRGPRRRRRCLHRSSISCRPGLRRRRRRRRRLGIRLFLLLPTVAGANGGALVLPLPLVPPGDALVAAVAVAVAAALDEDDAARRGRARAEVQDGERRRRDLADPLRGSEDLLGWMRDAGCTCSEG